MSIKTLRDRYKHLFWDYVFLGNLFGAWPPDHKRGVAQNAARLKSGEKLPRSFMKGMMNELTSTVKKLRKRAKPTQHYHDVRELFLKEYPHDEMFTGRKVAYMPALLIHAAFDGAMEQWPSFGSLPPHGMVGLDLYGTTQQGKPVFLWSAASLFEDLALLTNEAVSADTATLEGHKRQQAFARASVKAAFSLLEGYLNGVAADIQINRLGALTEKDIDKLQERNRTFLTLSKKLTQYSKLAAGTEHPPFQVSSSPFAGPILNLEERVRHTLIHPKPARMTEYITFELADAESCCDAALGLIQEFHALIVPHGDYGDLSMWLYERGADGLFPHEAVAHEIPDTPTQTTAS